MRIEWDTPNGAVEAIELDCTVRETWEGTAEVAEREENFVADLEVRELFFRRRHFNAAALGLSAHRAICPPAAASHRAEVIHRARAHAQEHSRLAARQQPLVTQRRGKIRDRSAHREAFEIGCLRHDSLASMRNVLANEPH